MIAVGLPLDCFSFHLYDEQNCQSKKKLVEKFSFLHLFLFMSLFNTFSSHCFLHLAFSFTISFSQFSHFFPVPTSSFPFIFLDLGYFQMEIWGNQILEVFDYRCIYTNIQHLTMGFRINFLLYSDIGSKYLKTGRSSILE